MTTTPEPPNGLPSFRRNRNPIPGDAVELWLQRQLDATPNVGAYAMANSILANVLAKYRAHAATGTPLDQETPDDRP